MKNITDAFNELMIQIDPSESEAIYKLKTIHFKKPCLMIGIDSLTKERRLYIDVTQENWSKEKMRTFPKWRGLTIKEEFHKKIGPLTEKKMLVLYQESDQSIEIFDNVIQSIYDNIIHNSEEDLFSTLYTVLDQWKNFFMRKRESKLTLEEQMGLYGELYFFRAWLNKFSDAPPTIIDHWKGPLMNRIDYVAAKTGVEIKTICPKIREDIRISNERQLELTPIIKNLYLYVLRVEISDVEGESLFNLLTDIIDSLSKRAPSTIVSLENLLLELRIIKEDYTENKFSVLEDLAYKVNDDFPKLTPNMLPKGVSYVSYSVDLSHCEEFKVNSQDVYYLNHGS
ncbi:PD-(D/E)XK motif protein [Paenibacillus xylanexedens]|uniref:PD-(D/E)XK motif protein n=1 Tax=Paenibacillus xylanexedens TaxID=528191 RepID=UPI003D05D2F1